MQHMKKNIETEYKVSIVGKEGIRELLNTMNYRSVEIEPGTITQVGKYFNAEPLVDLLEIVAEYMTGVMFLTGKLQGRFDMATYILSEMPKEHYKNWTITKEYNQLKKQYKCSHCGERGTIEERVYIDELHCSWLYPGQLIKEEVHAQICTKCNQYTVSGGKGAHNERMASIFNLQKLNVLTDKQLSQMRGAMEVSIEDYKRFLEVQDMELRPTPPHDSSNCLECQSWEEAEIRVRDRDEKAASDSD